MRTALEEVDNVRRILEDAASRLEVSWKLRVALHGEKHKFPVTKEPFSPGICYGANRGSHGVKRAEKPRMVTVAINSATSASQLRNEGDVRLFFESSEMSGEGERVPHINFSTKPVVNGNSTLCFREQTHSLPYFITHPFIITFAHCICLMYEYLHRNILYYLTGEY